MMVCYYVSIYDMMGRKIKTLINSFQKSGDNSVQWDATNNLGNKVPSGVYLYSIKVGDFNQTKKDGTVKVKCFNQSF